MKLPVYPPPAEQTGDLPDRRLRRYAGRPPIIIALPMGSASAWLLLHLWVLLQGVYSGTRTLLFPGSASSFAAA